MTEEEVKTKWCPFARIIGGRLTADGTAESAVAQAAFNRVTLPDNQQMTPHASKCLGSACMAWRLDHEWNKAIPNDSPAAHGFCGLAGKP